MRAETGAQGRSGRNGIFARLLVPLGILASAAALFAAGEAGGVITYEGDQVVHTFTSGGTFVPAAGVVRVEVLVVAAGGGGGGSNNARRAGGGGGGGEVIFEPSVETSGPVTVTVGSGGEGGAGNAVGGSGRESAFGPLLARGGGGGGSGNMGGLPGASGGGGGNGAGGAGGSGVVIVRYPAPRTSLSVHNDVALAIGPTIVAAGQGPAPASDASSSMDWSSAAGPDSPNKIQVRIAGGALPAGLRLTVDTDRAVAPVELEETARDFITGIASGSATDQVLRYTLEVTDIGALSGGSSSLVVEYTLTAQDP